MKLGPLNPFLETIQELSGSKKSTIFLLAIFGLAFSDSLGFEGVHPKWRLAFAVMLIIAWMSSQTFIDCFGKNNSDNSVDQSKIPPVQPPTS